MMTKGKADKLAVDYRAAECCFHCAGFLRPDAPGVVEGQCVKVKGAIHPGSTCDLFEFAIDDDGDDDGRPDDREHTHPSPLSLSDGQLGGLQLQQRGRRLFSVSRSDTELCR